MLICDGDGGVMVMVPGLIRDGEDDGEGMKEARAATL